MASTLSNNSYNLIHSTTSYFYSSVSCKLEHNPIKINVRKPTVWQWTEIQAICILFLVKVTNSAIRIQQDQDQLVMLYIDNIRATNHAR